jgi:hypothetical protein
MRKISSGTIFMAAQHVFWWYRFRVIVTIIASVECRSVPPSMHDAFVLKKSCSRRTETVCLGGSITE